MKYLEFFENFNDEIHIDDIYYILDKEMLEKEFDYFHISSIFLLNNNSPYFTFKPKKPEKPYEDEMGNVIEDDFTKRISLCNTIKNCENSIPHKDGSLYGVGKEEIDQSYLINISETLPYCPDINGRPFIDNFYLEEWLESLTKKQQKEISNYTKRNYGLDFSTIDSPSFLPKKYRNMFFACVPDADETGEYWYLKRLKMEYLGEIIDNYIYYDPGYTNYIPNFVKKYGKKETS